MTENRTGGAEATGRAARIRDRLVARFAPEAIAVRDESARHAGHAGVRAMTAGAGGAVGETHYALEMVSSAFDGLGRVQRSRLVHEALAAEFGSGLHALSLVLRTPSEQAEAGPDTGPRGLRDPG